MKKTIFTLLVLLTSVWSWAQIITSTPQFITQDAGGTIDLVYDATLGTAGLKNLAATDTIFAHTGVITTLSSGPSDWKHAPTWLDNSKKYKLTSLGSNKWKFSITPDMTTFYGLKSGEIVKKICFVFRNKTGTLQGKDINEADIFVNVYQAGLNVAFTNPLLDQAVTLGTTMNIGVSSSVAANMNLLINGTSVQTATAATSLTYSKTFDVTGDYTLIAEAVTNTTTVRDTIYICVPKAITLQSRPAGALPGINYNASDPTTVTLVLHAPNKSIAGTTNKTNVFLIGDMNNWLQKNDFQLKNDGEYWWITLTGLIPGKMYGYQYLVDGILKVSDAYTELVLDPWNDKWINQYYPIYPNIKEYPVGKTDGLVATLQTAKTPYNWQVPNFTMPPVENMVIYELLLRDFTPEKSLDAAILKLDYLKNLGITAVELMPIQEFDGNNSWGYNPNHYFAPDKAYGNPDTYKKFIDECHKRGMAVILDMVFNQATGIFPFAALYWDASNSKPAANNPWMNITAPHQFSVLNDFNHSYSGTKEYFKRVLQYWIKEYKVDGYRMDLTKGFTQNSNTEGTYDSQRVDNIVAYNDAVKAVKNDAMFILEHFVGGSEEDNLAGRGMFLWRNSNTAYSQAAMGFSSNSDFGGMNSLPRRWVGYAESHDEERNFYQAKTYGAGSLKTDSIARVNRVPLNIAFSTLLPGPKMLWQFGELGYDYSINSFGGRTDTKPSVWGWFNLAHRKAAADASAKIITLRRLYPTAFTQGNFALNVGSGDWAAGRRVALSHADLNMVMLGNFEPTNTITANPSFQKTGTWYNLLTGLELNVSNTQMTFSMQPGELLIFTDRKVNLPNGLNSVKNQNDCSVFPSVTNGKVYISTRSIVKNVRIYNLQGTILKESTNTTEIDLTNMTNGLYLVEVNTLNGRGVYKIIKE